jgi:choline dehydrogenase-like flavoprotein
LTGLVVANKLSETGAKVLVVEAGPDLNNFTAINDPTQSVSSATYLPNSTSNLPQ